MPRRAIEFAVRVWDEAGAAALMLEAVDEAVESLSGRIEDWESGLARECVAYSIRVRISLAQ